MKYIKQLDAVRAIAVILVIITHWFYESIPFNASLLGWAGVDIFFVLSGFLISKILMDYRRKAEADNQPKSELVKNFYIRRALRIFPIYYLYVLVIYLFRNYTKSSIDEALPYLLTYTQNFFFFKIHRFDGIISHLWSLAVEEQFYLIWPWLMLFIKKKYFLPVILLFILTGTVSQYFMSSKPLGIYLPFACFDSFGLGALLAWQITYRNIGKSRFFLITSLSAFLSVCLLVWGLISNSWMSLIYRTEVSVIAVWIITYIVYNHNSKGFKFKIIFNNPILIFIGKISYGIYLYQILIPSAINLKIVNVYFNPLLPDFLYKNHWNFLFVAENVIILVAISWISYVIIESPFLRLKRFFGNKKETILPY